jgi:FkbH-like protein
VNAKADNIPSFVSVLVLGLVAAVFIDDTPVERDNVRRYLPEVLVLGDYQFTVRSRLLTGPEFQVPSVTVESRNRTRMMKEQVGRRRVKEEALDSDDYVRSLEVRVEVGRVFDPALLDRIAELVQRTNQFNTTGIRFSKDELRALLAGEQGRELFAMRVADRFGDHGLVGACVVLGDRVELFVMSCRVIGLGVERVLLGRAVESALERSPTVTARLVPTDRNTPARHLFRDGGFVEVAGGEERDSGATEWVLDGARFATDARALPWREVEDLYHVEPLEPEAVTAGAVTS